MRSGASIIPYLGNPTRGWSRPRDGVSAEQPSPNGAEIRLWIDEHAVESCVFMRALRSDLAHSYQKEKRTLGPVEQWFH
jgi:hypothetical protein